MVLSNEIDALTPLEMDVPGCLLASWTDLGDGEIRPHQPALLYVQCHFNHSVFLCVSCSISTECLKFSRDSTDLPIVVLPPAYAASARFLRRCEFATHVYAVQIRRDIAHTSHRVADVDMLPTINLNVGCSVNSLSPYKFHINSSLLEKQ